MDKFEDELAAEVEEPTTPEYEETAAAVREPAEAVEETPDLGI